MSVSNFEASMENLFNFKPSEVGVETNKALIFEEVTKELEAFRATESDDKTCRQSLTWYKKNLTS